MRLIVTENFTESSRVTAGMFSETIRKNPNALLGCATGSSLLGVYEQLVKEYTENGLDFSKTRTVNLDEYLGLDQIHPQSFAFFMEKHFFSHVNIQRQNCYLIDGSGNSEQELSKFNNFLEKNIIDILMLGVGSNGHIGFNEPDNVFIPHAHLVRLLDETITANSRFYNDKIEVPKNAVTMGMKDIVKARKVILVISGKNKAKAIKTLLTCQNVDPRFPCSILLLCSDFTLVIDRELYNMAAES
jgi:glucosamine-6-phosphate deaminase